MNKKALQSKVKDEPNEQQSKSAKKAPLPRYEATPMKLLQIALRFEFISPLHFEEGKILELVDAPTDDAQLEETQDLLDVFARRPVDGFESLYIQGLQNAAYLYDLAKSVILERREADPRVVREAQKREISLQRKVLMLWRTIESHGELIKVETALDKGAFKTKTNLNSALRKLAYFRKEQDYIPSTVICVMLKLRKKWERHLV